MGSRRASVYRLSLSIRLYLSTFLPPEPYERRSPIGLFLNLELQMREIPDLAKPIENLHST